jgi:putative membrane protein
MDVAGAGAREGSLAFLPLREAEELRETLLARRDAVRAGREPAGGTTADDVPAVPAAVPEHVVAKLDLAMLVVSLLLSPEAFAFLVSAIVLGGLFAFVGDLGGAAVAFPIVIGFVLTQFRKLSAYYDFTVSETAAGLQVRRGLFDRNTQTIRLARVQGVVVSEPLFWRGFGWARVDVSVAGYGSGESDGKPSLSTVMPVAPRSLVLWLARRLLAETGAPDPDDVALTPPPPRSRWVAPLQRHFLSAGVGPHLLVSRSGLLNRRTHAVPHARVQSLQVHQGPWQRRFGLADLTVDSPPGPVSVRARHRDAGEARRLLVEANALAREARGRLQG